jgi:hypothetical protein
MMQQFQDMAQFSAPLQGASHPQDQATMEQNELFGILKQGCFEPLSSIPPQCRLPQALIDPDTIPREPTIRQMVLRPVAGHQKPDQWLPAAPAELPVTAAVSFVGNPEAFDDSSTEIYRDGMPGFVDTSGPINVSHYHSPVTVRAAPDHQS